MRFNLVVAFVDPNLTEKVVKTAKEAGATGDVIIKGKGTGIEPSNFLGLSIQDKTDIILLWLKNTIQTESWNLFQRNAILKIPVME